MYKISIMTPSWMETFHIFLYTFTPATFSIWPLVFPKSVILSTKPSVDSAYLMSFVLLFLCAALITLHQQWRTFLGLYNFSVAYPLQFLCCCFWCPVSIADKILLSEYVKLRSKMILLGFAISASVPLSDFVSNVFFKCIFSQVSISIFHFSLSFLLSSAIPSSSTTFLTSTLSSSGTYGYVLTTGTLGGIYGLFVLVSNVVFGQI